MKEGYEVLYQRPKALLNTRMHYCPGCFHSTMHKLLMEVVDELDIQEKTIGVCPVGCSVFAYDYMDVDMQEAAHGRAAAVATGIKRVLPDRIVFSYQGDGDLAAIGTAETLHACNRGENFTFIFINNGIYGMTGGQMAPTTLLGMKATTAPLGREARREGFPLDISGLVAAIPGSAYVVRTAVNSPAAVRNTKKAIRQAFECQLDDEGFSLVEVVSQCPTNWKMDTITACKWIDEEVTEHYPLGVLQDSRKKAERKKKGKK